MSIAGVTGPGGGDMLVGDGCTTRGWVGNGCVVTERVGSGCIMAGWRITVGIGDRAIDGVTRLVGGVVMMD